MPVDLERLQALRIVTPHSYTSKDVMLYALGLGLGADPLDPKQLAFTYEGALQVLPTFGGVMGYPGFWPKDRLELGINWQKLLNGEQGIRIHRPLPVEGDELGTMVVDRVIDKGTGKGSILYISREVTDKASGELLCTVTNTVVLRGDGGFGGAVGTADPVAVIPAREPDLVVDWPTLPQAALIYRLSGDYNPLHADPAVARQGGFERPILHGSASWGMAGHALLQALCAGDPQRFCRFHVRFTSPAYPGDLQQTQIWKTSAGEAAFRVVVPERGVTVLDNGVFSHQAD